MYLSSLVSAKTIKLRASEYSLPVCICGGADGRGGGGEIVYWARVEPVARE